MSVFFSLDKLLIATRLKSKPRSPIKRVVQPDLPKPTFAGVLHSGDSLHIAHTGSTRIQSFKPRTLEASLDSLPEWLRSWSSRSKRKIIAAGLAGGGVDPQLAARLWLEEDIVPYIQTHASQEKSAATSLAAFASSRFTNNHLVKMNVTADREIIADHLITLKDHQSTATELEFKRLTAEVERFKGKRVMFISATPQGGGVALMRHALMRLYRSLGVDAHWHVLKEDADVFFITKTKFHNVLQAVASPDVQLTDEDKKIYLEWSKHNAEVLRPAYTKADVIIIDDPQPAGLIPYIKKDNPNAKLLYRSHIQIVAELANTVDTPQHITWQFIWRFAKAADAFIAHPISAFVPAGVPKSRLVIMPATGDPLDGLNKPLTKQQLKYYRDMFNDFLIHDNQTPLDSNRSYLTQIARFDPSKGIPDVLEAYRSLRERMENDGKTLPQLVIAGFGSIDDPDGTVILDLTMTMLQQERFAEIAADVKVARLPHIDQILNMLMRESAVYMQLSHKEGYEEKVSTALMMGKPAVVYNAGGIPLQVVDGKSGYVVEVGDTEAVADRLYNLLTNDELYESMCAGALNLFNRECRTIPNATKWLYLANELLEKDRIDHSKKDFVELFATRSN